MPVGTVNASLVEARASDDASGIFLERRVLKQRTQHVDEHMVLSAIDRVHHLSLHLREDEER